MSIQQNFPAISPSLSLNFARSKTLDPRITFTRTSSATRVNGQGLIEVVGANTPRFDHSYDPVSGTVKSLGLLIEEERSNLFTRSEDWSAYQAKQSLDVTINDITSPDGTETADKLQCNASGLSNDGHIQKLQTVTASTKTYTTSWFVKRGNTDRTNLSTALSSGTYLAVYAYIDWTSSPVSFNFDGQNGSPVYTVHPLEEYPNGWYRASISITNNNTNTQITNRIYASSRSSTVSGDYVYAWGSQAEEGAFPTSYIPTTTSTATRTADNASMVGDNFSSWYNQSEGSVRIKTKVNQRSDGTNKFPYAMQIDDGTGDNIILIDNAVLSNGNIRQVFAIRNTGNDITSGMGNSKDYNNLPCSFAYSDNDFAFVNGAGTLFADDDGIVPKTMNRLQLGEGVGQPLNGTISQLTYYPRRLTNTQLQNLTK